ncbi:MAG: acetyl-CoA carboxylase biotin carboxyl carrier protein [Deltaproteobacteria bacterium]|nr:acetyl-CoA carboxylase biotin carboxyl carrier protein [Deltaproteobacteria bacterium]
MELTKIEKLLQLMKNYGLHEIELKDGDTKVRLVQSAPSSSPFQIPPGVAPYPAYMPAFSPQNTANTPAATTHEAEDSALRAPTAQTKTDRRSSLKEVRSPFVGTFYRAPAPGSDDFVRIGQKVSKGDTLCIVEAMKLMNEIEAEQDGVIAEILINNEEPVEYDQVLFLME